MLNSSLAKMDRYTVNTGGTRYEIHQMMWCERNIYEEDQKRDEMRASEIDTDRDREP